MQVFYELSINKSRDFFHEIMIKSIRSIFYWILDAFEEYLIVRASEISKDGNECDKVGVGFKAFVEQPDRCGRLEGTCLKNQPLSYWKHDRVRINLNDPEIRSTLFLLCINFIYEIIFIWNYY